MFESRIALDKLGRRMAATPVEGAWRPVDVADLRARVEAALLRSTLTSSPRP